LLTSPGPASRGVPAHSIDVRTMRILEDRASLTNVRTRPAPYYLRKC
jgi:hypothetical protein